MVSTPVSPASHSSHHSLEIKRVDEGARKALRPTYQQACGGVYTSVPIKSGFKRGFCVLRACTLSTHFVSTLCRIHFVSTLCPYALSKAEDQANVPPSRSLPMRLGARGLRGFCGAHEAENVTAGDTTSPRLRSTGGGLQRSGFPFTFAGACTEPPRPPRWLRLTVQHPRVLVLVLVFVLVLEPGTAGTAVPAGTAGGWRPNSPTPPCVWRG